MKTLILQNVQDDPEQIIEPVGYDFGLSRRAFVQVLGARIVIASAVSRSVAQERESGQRAGRGGGRGGGGGGPVNLDARLHIGKDGSITVMAGKVEGGQGARAELTQAAAEELRVDPIKLQMILADTSVVPNDGITAGSGSTPRTVPSIRQAAAAVRFLLVDFACKKWDVEASSCEVRDGKVIHSDKRRTLSYADLAADEEATKGLSQPVEPAIS